MARLEEYLADLGSGVTTRVEKFVEKTVKDIEKELSKLPGFMGSGGVCGQRRNTISPEMSREQAHVAGRPLKVTSCEVCCRKFSLIIRKRQCDECRRSFCGVCLLRDRSSCGRQLCGSCKVLLTRPLRRDDLMQLRVKDLQHYLVSQHVSTKSCVEKEDLVDLVLECVQPRVEAADEMSPYARRWDSSQSEAAAPSDPPPQTTEGHWALGVNTLQSEDLDSFRSSVTSSFQHIPSQSPETPAPVTVPSCNPLNIGSSGTASSPDRQSHPEHTDSQDMAESETAGAGGVEVSSGSVSTCSSCSCSVIELAELCAHSDTSASQLDLNQDSTGMPSEVNHDVEPDTESHSEESVSQTSPPVVALHIDECADAAVEVNVGEKPAFPSQKLPVSLADIRMVDDLDQLSVKQLKTLLGSHRVDYKGCCEKYELLERVKRLWQDEQEARRVVEELPDEALCKVCMDAPIDCVMLECGHMATCTSCGKKMNECPICRQFVVRVVRIFKV